MPHRIHILLPLLLLWNVWQTGVPEHSQVAAMAVDRQHRLSIVHPDTAIQQQQLYGRFMHFTDMHPDHHYQSHAEIKTQCHRAHAIDAADRVNGTDGDLNAEDADAELVLDMLADDKVLPQPQLRTEDTSLRHLLSSWLEQLTAYVTPTVNGGKKKKKAKSPFPRPPRYRSGQSGQLGTPLTKCDSPWSLINGTFDWLNEHIIGRDMVHPLPASFNDSSRQTVQPLGIDFVVCTGDNARHDADRKVPRSMDHIMQSNQRVVHLLQDRLPANLPVVMSIGNNDIYPHNVMLPGPNPVLRLLLTAWRTYIPEDQTHTFLEGGYYINEVVRNQLVVISLNTNYFFASNPVVDGCNSAEDAGSRQLAWLEQRLLDANARHLTVYVIGHVAPTALLYHRRCYRRYTWLMREFGGFSESGTGSRDAIVAGQFFGHSNVDHFYFLEPDLEMESGSEVNEQESSSARSDDYLHRLFKQYKRAGRGGRALGPAVFIAPSVIPTYNPTVRIMSYSTTPSTFADRSTAEVDRFGALQDYAQYFFDLLARQGHPKHGKTLQHNAPVNYTVEYTAREAYGIRSLSPDQLTLAAKRVSKDKQLQHQFMQRYFVQTF